MISAFVPTSINNCIDEPRCGPSARIAPVVSPAAGVVDTWTPGRTRDVRVGQMGPGGPTAKAGTFVEVKNSIIGEGSKVPHLSYIGDAEIGSGVNLGAGTVTANYDGRAKHPTTIGNDVHTGVHTVLVAPVEVGDGAETGAGAVVTRDVPPGRLVKGVPARDARPVREDGE